MSSPLKFTRVSPTRLFTCKLFNRELKAMHRSMINSADMTIHKTIAEQMVDRRSFVKRDTPIVLEVGSSGGWYLRHLLKCKNLFGLKQYIQTDISEERLNKNYAELKEIIPPGVELVQICCDEEVEDPFEIPEKSIDCAVSCLSMHWCNDLESTLVSIRRALKRDSFFLLSMFGGNTLYELRTSFTLAEKEALGGLSPHISPMIDGAGVSSLLLQTGYCIPSLDLDRFVLTYASPFHLMEHLQRMGENGAHVMRRDAPRSAMLGMAAIYESMFGKKGVCPATFEVFHAICWSPSPDQQQALQPGNAQLSFKSIGTPSQKELQQVIDEMTNRPDDPAVRIRAEAMLARMSTEMQQQARKRMEEEESIVEDLDEMLDGRRSGHTVLPPRPAPPDLSMREEVVLEPISKVGPEQPWDGQP